MLFDEPISYQLTVHRNNYIAEFGPGSFERDLYDVIKNGDKPYVLRDLSAMAGLVNHYRITTILKFLKEFRIVRV